MIPKIIHYCWFGGKPLPKLAKKCIASWKKYCPDYEIIQWNESNYDVYKNNYIREAYKAKKWAFVSDYARLDIIYNYGGIYLDTDVEVLKSFDEFLKYPAFCGFENEKFVNFGLGFGAEKGNNVIKNVLEIYEPFSFDMDLETKKYLSKQQLEYYDKNKMFIPSPIIQTQSLRKYYGLKCDNSRQSLETMEIFPFIYFSPINQTTGKITITTNTFSIHHYMASWCTASSRIRGKIYRLLARFLSKGIADFVKKVWHKIIGQSTANFIRKMFGRKNYKIDKK